MTVNGSKKTSIPIYGVAMNAVDGRAAENIAGTKMSDFTTIKRPTFKEFKEKFPHIEERPIIVQRVTNILFILYLGMLRTTRYGLKRCLRENPEIQWSWGTTFGVVVQGG